MKAAYQIADRKDSRALARFLSGEGQALLPMLELIEQAEVRSRFPPTRPCEPTRVLVGGCWTS